MTDFFVAAGPTAGDGTRQQPFHDPWLALWTAAPGDRIHIAAGTYTGRGERSSWVIDCPGLTVLGGYSIDFATRTPWHTPTVFAARAGLRVPHEPSMLQGIGNHDGLVLDGLFFDGSGRADYDEQGDLVHASYGDGPIVSLRGAQITVRGCAFANGSSGAVDISGAGMFENNIVVNSVGPSLLTVRDGDPQAPITVSRSTFCFAHDDSGPPRGSGADQADGVRVSGAATIVDNVFVGCGNAAIACLSDVAQIGVDRNLFFATLRDIVRRRVAGAEAEITEEYAEELEDVGLRSASGNTIGDPQLIGLPTAWIDAYTVGAAATYARPPRAALNALRNAVGLGELPSTLDSDAQPPIMRRLTPAEVLAISVGAAQGSHPTGQAAAEPLTERQPDQAYQIIDWARLYQADPALEGTVVEVRAGVGFDQNTQIIPELAETHIGVVVYEPGTDNTPWWALAPRYGRVHHQLEEAIRYPRGLDVESTYLLRGTYRTDVAPGGRQAVTVVLDSTAPAIDIAPPAAQRPIARDWFVRAGSSGGDGSREMPFRDPFQALEKATAGDRILVSEGDYAGRLRLGTWRIPVHNLTMLGGWDPEFGARDPWRHPVRFVLTPETKAKGVFGDPIMTVEDSSEGIILDGFVFDGSTYNAYADSGALDVGQSQSAALLDLRGGSGGVTVRNCVFANAAYCAVQISAAYGTFENNVVVNTSGTSVRLQVPGTGPWTVRGNTVLFAADPTGRASTGQSTSGCLLDISGRGVVRVESTVLAFADSIAVRATIPGQNLVLDANVLAANLYADIFDGRNVLVDAENGPRVLLDAPFGDQSGTRSELPAMPVDPAYAHEAIGRLSALAAAMPKDGLNAAAAALGVSIAARSADAPDTPVEAAAPTEQPSVADLLADLGRAREAFEAKDAPPPPTDAPLYCPVYPVTAALKLALDAPSGEPGAHAITVA